MDSAIISPEYHVTLGLSAQGESWNPEELKVAGRKRERLLSRVR
jgi:hypothetical protein